MTSLFHYRVEHKCDVISDADITLKARNVLVLLPLIPPLPPIRPAPLPPSSSIPPPHVPCTTYAPSPPTWRMVHRSLAGQAEGASDVSA